MPGTYSQILGVRDMDIIYVYIYQNFSIVHFNMCTLLQVNYIPIKLFKTPEIEPNKLLD